MCRQRRQVVGIVVHVMAVAGLGGSPVAAPVMGDHAIAVLEEEQHLCVPVIGRQRPTVAEHNGLTVSPVLVEDFRAIRGSDRTHVGPPLGRPGMTLIGTGYQYIPAPLPSIYLDVL